MLQVFAYLGEQEWLLWSGFSRAGMFMCAPWLVLSEVGSAADGWVLCLGGITSLFNIPPICVSVFNILPIGSEWCEVMNYSRLL